MSRLDRGKLESLPEWQAFQRWIALRIVAHQDDLLLATLTGLPGASAVAGRIAEDLEVQGWADTILVTLNEQSDAKDEE